MKCNPDTAAPIRQRGATLLVAIVLLLLAGVMTLLALNVGMFESRSTGNDMRAKMVNEAAEAGLAQGFEFLMRQKPAWLDDATKWQLCQSADTKFPCGAVQQFEPDGITPRRATMYRYVGTGATIPGFPAELKSYMLPLTNAFTDAGKGFAVEYGVAPLLCRVERPTAGQPANTPVRCATDIAKATKQRIGTFVSVAAMPGEAARTTLVQIVGQYSLLEAPIGLPPFMASGSIDVTGGLNIVTNPNAGGPGVPVSVWTRKDIEKTGNPNTCYLDEFLRYSKHGTPSFEGVTTKVMVCDDCDCEGDKSLSYDKAGNVIDEGIDILDIDNNALGGINRDVKPEEFPCDIFQFVFNVKAWSDDGLPDPPYDDYFCETRVPKLTYIPDWAPARSRSIYPDEAFLYANAKAIVNPTGADADYLMPGSGKQVDESYLDENARGIVWCQSDCDLGNGRVIGSPDHPVLLVVDTPPGTEVMYKSKLYGMLFVRSLGDGPLSEADGGAAEFRMNAGGIIYGSLVVHGKVNKANGHAAVVHNADIMFNLFNNPDNIRYATLPGAWNDQRSY